ncbi:hypothetical protein [Pantoea sp. BAV 3049]|uniref:hypothetical protein n=1 Tax=Pantoea sp. BAV 3049 TaxID=2654188 RepID=UPI00131A8BB4|nr:hypothetical protein [Pantoea sp. BAV 3049]
MNDTNVFALAQVIKAAGSDPSDVTDAVWAAGYRKSERSTEDAVALTLEIICGCHGADMPWDVWPKNYSSVLKEELNECVYPAVAPDGSTAVSAAKSIIAAGYQRMEVTSD